MYVYFLCLFLTLAILVYHIIKIMSCKMLKYIIDTIQFMRTFFLLMYIEMKKLALTVFTIVII